MVRQKYMHSIRFGDGTLDNRGRFKGIDTYTDWHLIPTSRPTIEAPGIESKFVTIPGRDGLIDISEYLHKDRPAYGNRDGSFEFYIDNEYMQSDFWMTIYPIIQNTLHGRKFKMVLNEDDPDYYWEGRFTVGKLDPGDGSFSRITIGYSVHPFKRKIRKYSQGMVWDNFNFERDYDYTPFGLTSITLSNETLTKIISGDGAPFPLEVSCTNGSVTVTFGGETKTVSSGNSAEVGHAAYGNNVLTITGTGKASIDWRGGSL